MRKREYFTRKYSGKGQLNALFLSKERATDVWPDAPGSNVLRQL